MTNTTQQALQKARQTIVDLRTVLDPFDAPAKVVWAASDHTLQTIDAALAALSAGGELQPVIGHLHSNGDFCCERMPGAVTSWPVSLYKGQDK